LFTLVDRDPLEAKIYLPEKEIFGIQPKQKVSLTLNAQKSLTFEGHIKQINPSVDPKTGTVKVTVEVNQAPSEVRPGSFVDVRLVTQQHDNALLIPKKALIEEAGEQYVFLINNGAALRRTVRTGFMDDENAEVLSGLSAGNPVVIAGQGSLRDGTKTQIVANR
jgi:membrane fusion protein (multidrug efflux system)